MVGLSYGTLSSKITTSAEGIECVSFGIRAEATNGIEAIEKARSYRPNVAVVDISMPLMDGIEATEHIRECCRLTRVIILSGFKDSEYVRHALEVGAKGYVLKDTAANDLLEGIRRVDSGKYYFSHQIAEFDEKYLPR